ncbi:putative DDE Tnp4 domain-containing protein [Phytophthora infestans]|uniref:Putative DDE Tnp4 domain-containing protein n=1 Tax=Phytophthora infestans TaxID=4787 RepID=A0A833WH23_PHYIN|nr:putative DDE Tnp4 domain-containing protein [Phytophthora infestans]
MQGPMRGAGVLLALCATSQTRHNLEKCVKRLRIRLHEDRRHVEWERLLRMRHYVTLDCLKHPEESNWMVFWRRNTEKNMLSKTSLSRGAFEQPLERFSQFYIIPVYNPAGGRPRRLQHHHQVLGLLLAFYVGSMKRSTLCSEFGVPPSTLSRVLNAAEEALASALVGFSPARIVWPSPARQRALAQLVESRQPMLRYTWGFSMG